LKGSIEGRTGIRMDKPQDVSPRGSRASVHLDAAAPVGMEQADAVRAGDGYSLIQAAPIHDNYLKDTLETGKHVESCTQGAGLVECRYDDRDQSPGVLGAAHGFSRHGSRWLPLTSAKLDAVIHTVPVEEAALVVKAPVALWYHVCTGA
jgi:hypothetical protein